MDWIIEPKFSGKHGGFLFEKKKIQTMGTKHLGYFCQ